MVGAKNLQRVGRANPNTRWANSESPKLLSRSNRYVLPAICRQFCRSVYMSPVVLSA